MNFQPSGSVFEIDFGLFVVSTGSYCRTHRVSCRMWNFRTNETKTWERIVVMGWWNVKGACSLSCCFLLCNLFTTIHLPTFPFHPCTPTSPLIFVPAQPHTNILFLSSCKRTTKRKMMKNKVSSVFTYPYLIPPSCDFFSVETFFNTFSPTHILAWISRGEATTGNPTRFL